MDDDTIYMGAYRPETLRITNGTASPDPSVIRKSTELRYQASEEHKVREEFETAPSTPNNYESFNLPHADMHVGPSHETILTFNEKRQQAETPYADKWSRGQHSGSYELRRASEPAMSCMSVPRKNEPSPPRMYKPATFEDACTSHERFRERSHSRTAYLQDPPQSQSYRCVDNSSSKDHDRKMSQQSIDIISRQSSEPVIQSIDDGKVSPVITDTVRPNEVPNKADMPRFAQRWSHRLSHISHEPGSESQLPPNPYEGHAALRNLSNRLSTVTDKTDRDREEAKATALETPEVALAKLNGEIYRHMLKQTKDDAPNDSSDSPIPSAESLHDKPNRPSPHEKTESGYGSDVSHLPMEQKEAREANRVQKFANVMEQTHRAYEGLSIDDDEVSLYSFNQVLKSPYLLSGLATPSPPTARGSRKHLSSLGLNRAKRSSSLQAQNPNDAALARELADPAPLESKTLKLQKKLQKPMPISIWKNMNAEMTKKEEERSPQVAVLPGVFDELEGTFSRRSDVELPTSAASRVSNSNRATVVESNIPVETNTNSRPTQTSRATPHHTRSRNSISTPGPDKPRFGDVSRETGAEDNVTLDVPSSSSRNRSESTIRSGSTTPRASQFDIARMSCLSGPAEIEGKHSVAENAPIPTNHRLAISSPSNPSAALCQRTVSVPNTTPHHGRKSDETRPGFSRSKSGVSRGKEAKMAPELGRMKSRDVAVQNNEEIFDRPKRATPKSSSSKKSTLQTSSSSPGDGVNHGVDATLPSGGAQLDRPPSSIAESIPPRPKLPANVGAKVSKLNGTVTEQLRDSVQSNPVIPTSSHDRPGDSTESIADVVKRAVQARKAQETGQIKDDRDSNGSRLPAARKSKSKKKRSKVQFRELDSSVTEDLIVDNAGAGSPPSFCSPNSEQPNWEQQAKLWRQRRESIGQTLSKPIPTDEERNEDCRPEEALKSPTNVVSRPIVQSTGENDDRSDADHQRSNFTELHADIHRDLIGDKKEHDPARDGVELRDSTVVTVQKWDDSSTQEERKDSAYLSKSYHSASSQIERTRILAVAL